MTGADCPGKSATQSVSCAETRSGSPVSREYPVCSGPRQLNQPRGAPAAPAIGPRHANKHPVNLRIAADGKDLAHPLRIVILRTLLSI